MSKQVRVLGVRFDAVTMAEAESVCRSALSRPAEFKIYTPNPEIVMRAVSDSTFQEVLERGDLIIPDGIGIVHATRLKGLAVPERVPGIELLDRIFAMAASEGKRVFLLGSKPGIAERAAENIVHKYPALTIAGVHDGYFAADAESELVSKIRSAAPDVLVVALGAPKQEIFIDRYLRESGAVIGIGVGGALDVYAGEVKRAPKFFQTIGMEWLYRGLKQPSRLPRLLKLPLFLLRIAFTKGSVVRVE